MLNHKGRWFRVRGPLNVARPVQGYPIIVQAGSSETGMDLAAETADVVFTAQRTLEQAQAFYADLKGRMAKYGRKPEHLKILPGSCRSSGERPRKPQKVRPSAVVDPSGGRLVALVRHAGRRRPVGLSVGRSVSARPSRFNGGKSRAALITEMAPEEGLTLRQVYLRIAGARGHWTVVGSPARSPISWSNDSAPAARRLQHHAGIAADQPQRVRRTGRSGAAAPRLVSSRLRGPHAPRQPRTAETAASRG